MADGQKYGVSGTPGFLCERQIDWQTQPYSANQTGNRKWHKRTGEGGLSEEAEVQEESDLAPEEELEEVKPVNVPGKGKW